MVLDKLKIFPQKSFNSELPGDGLKQSSLPAAPVSRPSSSTQSQAYKRIPVNSEDLVHCVRDCAAFYYQENKRRLSINVLKSDKLFPAHVLEHSIYVYMVDILVLLPQIS